MIGLVAGGRDSRVVFSSLWEVLSLIAGVDPLQQHLGKFHFFGSVEFFRPLGGLLQVRCHKLEPNEP